MASGEWRGGSVADGDVRRDGLRSNLNMAVGQRGGVRTNGVLRRRFEKGGLFGLGGRAGVVVETITVRRANALAGLYVRLHLNFGQIHCQSPCWFAPRLVEFRGALQEGQSFHSQILSAAKGAAVSKETRFSKPARLSPGI